MYYVSANDDVREYDRFKTAVLMVLVATLLPILWFGRDTARQTGQEQELKESVEALPPESAVTPAAEPLPPPVSAASEFALTAPQDGETFAADSATVRGKATRGDRVAVIVNSAIEGYVDVGVDGKWSYDIAMPEPGDYRITARARGADGIERGEATPIIIARLPAFKPLATPAITSPATDTVAAGEVTFAGTGEAGREVVLVVDSKEIGRTPVGEDGNWSITVPLAAADHDVHSYTIDDAGNALMSNSVHLVATGSAPAAGAVTPPTPAAAGGTIDSDGDAVADTEDRCAGTPAGVRVDASGCPRQGETLLTLAGVTFESGEATIRSDATAALDEAVKLLQENADVSVIIEGHTDDRGDENYNLYLSQQRADAVRQYLLDHGIAAERLEAVGKGESEPLGSNESEQARMKNRRVEFVVK